MKKELSIVKKDVVDIVFNKIKEYKVNHEMLFPEKYSPENSMKSAWLILQELKTRNKKLALEVCTKDSIANALLDMVIQGLSPAKKQCYFIVYGNKLQLMRSYFGTMAVTKRLGDIENINSQVVYADDEIEIGIEHGVKKIITHIQKFENIDITKIIGAYTVIETKSGFYTEVMNIHQIEQAWKQSKTSVFDNKGLLNKDSVHGKFTDQMVLKTVINRACKYFANTSNDSDLLIESFNNTTENEYVNDNDTDIIDEVIENEIELDFEEINPIDIIEDEGALADKQDATPDF